MLDSIAYSQLPIRKRLKKKKQLFILKSSAMLNVSKLQNVKNQRASPLSNSRRHTGIREPMTPNTNSCQWSFTRWLSYRYSENRSNTHEQATFWKRVDGSRKETKTTAARNRGRGSGWILKRRDGDVALTRRKLCAAISAVLQI